MTIQPRITFCEILCNRNDELFNKWYHNRYCVPYGATEKGYTNNERDELAICARLAHRYTNKGE